MAILKKLEALTIKDNFMFWAVMSRPENCKPFLEMTLGFPIGDLTVNAEKSLLYNPEYKGVRLDVEARDESHTHYNVEMQVAPRPALERRARYYHSQIDMELLARGGGYGSLPDSYVIFICDFDPFDCGRYCYTFRNMCQEKEGFALRDGLTTMFLSTRGKNPEEVPKSLVSFLNYVGSGLQESTKESDDGYVQQLQAAVLQVKASREMGARYVIFEEMLQEEHEAGRTEGREEGRAEGREEGRAEGREEGRTEGREEGRAKGKTEGKAESILDLLADLPGEVSEDLKERIFSENDSEVLRRYLKLAAAASSVEDFARQFSD